MEQSVVSAAKSRIERVFTQMAGRYDQSGPSFFTHFGRRLVERADIPQGCRVLDIATGRGAVLFPAAAAVGERGSVTGIDLTEAMVRETTQEVDRRGTANVEVRQMDAESLAFPDESFDVVLCGMGLMFFPQLGQALAEMRRVLVPGGSIAVSTFETIPLTPAIAPVVTRYQEDSRRPLTQDLASVDELRGALEGAGFQKVEIQRETLDIVYPDADTYWEWIMSLLVGPWLAMQPEEMQVSFRADVFAHLETIRQPDGIHESITALFGFGHP